MVIYYNLLVNNVVMVIDYNLLVNTVVMVIDYNLLVNIVVMVIDYNLLVNIIVMVIDYTLLIIDSLNTYQNVKNTTLALFHVFLLVLMYPKFEILSSIQ